MKNAKKLSLFIFLCLLFVQKKEIRAAEEAVANLTAQLEIERAARDEAETRLVKTEEQLKAEKKDHLGAAGEVVSRLVKYGVKVDVHRADASGRVPLMGVARCGDLDGVKLLVASGAGINVGNLYYWTPLKLAVGHMHFSVVEFFCSRDVFIPSDIFTDFPFLPPHEKCGSGHSCLPDVTDEEKQKREEEEMKRILELRVGQRENELNELLAAHEEGGVTLPTVICECIVGFTTTTREYLLKVEDASS